ncbi:MAG: hypothetical protein AAGA90_04530 [Actinomycetota bacterium]
MWRYLTLAALLVAAGCSREDCSCGAPAGDRVLEVAFAEPMPAGVVRVCFGACAEAQLHGGSHQQVDTGAFSDGWTEGRIFVSVTNTAGVVVAEFSTDPPMQIDSCCGPVWTVEQADP